MDERFKRLLPIAWRVLKRIRWWLLAVPMVTASGAYVLTFFLQEKYQSSQTVSLQDEATFNNLLEDLVAPVDNKANTVSAQSLVMTLPVLERIADKGGLLYKGISEPAKRQVLNNIAGSLEIQQDRKTPEIVTLTYTAGDRYTAQKLVKAVSREFLEETLNMRRKTAQLAVQFLKNQMDMLDTQLTGARKALSDYKAENLFSLPDIYLDGTLNLMQHKKELMESELQLKEISSQLELLRTSMKEYNPTLNQVKSKIFKIKQELIGLRYSLTEKHPLVIRKKRMKTELEKLSVSLAEIPADSMADPAGYALGVGLDSDSPVQVTGVESGVDLFTVKRKMQEQELLMKKETLESRIIQIKEMLGDMDISLAKIPEIEKQIDEYSGNIATLKKTRDEISRKYNDARHSIEITFLDAQSDFSILSPANIPALPFFPDKKLITLGGLFLGFILVLAGFMGIELLSGKIRDAYDIEVILEGTHLGSLPSIKQELA